MQQSLVKLEGWEKMVTIVACDMRCWDAPEKADILVRQWSSGLYLRIHIDNFIRLILFIGD